MVNAIIVKFGKGMNAKWDSDAVRSGDMGAFLESLIAFRPKGTDRAAVLCERAQQACHTAKP
ncbi:hypothetical protein EMIT0158MI4_20189 [Burkholderia ambifaria]